MGQAGRLLMPARMRVRLPENTHLPTLARAQTHAHDALTLPPYHAPRMELAVGKDLFSVCGKCGPQWHVIVAMDGGRVTKVQCKQCMGYHRYRVAPGEKDVNRAVRRVVASGAAKSSRPSAKKTATSRRRTASMPRVEPDLSRPVRNYKVADTYEPGERIEHPKFGEGIVESVEGPGKISVFFEEGRRTLVHGRAAASASSSLEG